MAGELVPTPPEGQLLVYRDGGLKVQVRIDGQTVWLTQRLIADLFQVAVPTVNEHLKNIYGDGELDAGATIRKFRIVQTEGHRQVSRLVEHYNLDAILAVGYRVRSARAAEAQVNRPQEEGRREMTAERREQTAEAAKLDKAIPACRSLGAGRWAKLKGMGYRE